jgi:hypothetical protein
MRLQVVAYLLASMLLGVVAAQLGQQASKTNWMKQIKRGWPMAALRFVYYIGLPYAAPYMGLVGLGHVPGSEQLSGQSWMLSRLQATTSLVAGELLPGLDTMVSLTLLLAALLGVAWHIYGRFKYQVVSSITTDSLYPASDIDTRFGRVIYQAVHWSFYRSAIWVLGGNLYLAVVGGMLLVGAEWMLTAGWLENISYAPRAEGPLFDATLLIATSVIFFFVPNLWLLIPAHWLLAKTGHWAISSGFRARDFRHS